FIMLVPIMALSGSLAGKKLVPSSGGSFPVWGLTFTLVLVGTVVIVGALTFLPALAMGPVVEHFLITGSKIIF
ncbi:MAG: potassium-transporting ATPase subunit KdpA, partial [Deltaproteobacteria bacterium]|nr:potassium-transporting ATPase subunit KdpA [Deltaproteobacteria bacterium]